MSQSATIVRRYKYFYCEMIDDDDDRSDDGEERSGT
jgi:hypothetical protein